MAVRGPPLVLALLFATSAAAENDDFNCPAQKGKLTFEEGWANAIPSDISRMWPSGTTVDFVCAIDARGRLNGCLFAVRPMDPALSPAMERSILTAMPRMVRYVLSDTPNQRCVASKLTFNFSDDVPGS